MSLETVTAPPAPPVQRLIYDGRLGELYRIFLENLLLGIVTLGIYRFWGRTRYRRYLWSHTTFSGDRFEYTGTGGELFRGFIIAMAIFLPIVIGIQFLPLILGDRPGLIVAIALPIYAVLIVLLFAAQYTALRYRLTRTRWRGIRGGLDGSAINFALRSIGYFLLSVLTLYQFVPFATVRLWRYRLNNLFFGTARAAFEGRGRDLYRRYLAAFLVWLLSAGLLAGVFFLLGHDSFDAVMGASSHAAEACADSSDPACMEQQPEMVAAMERLFYFIFGGVIALWIVGTVVFLWYMAFAFRYIVGRFKLAGIASEATVTAGKLFKLVVGNLLLLIFTLGIGYPIVLHRIWRFGADNLLIHGEIDGAVIAQSRLQPPRMGEGWLEVLDPGII